MHTDFPGSSNSTECACSAGDLGLIPGVGRCPGEGHGNPLHVLAWRIPWTEEPGMSIESQKVRHNWSDLPCRLETSKDPQIDASMQSNILHCQKESGRRGWLPTPVVLPGEVPQQRSLAGYSPRGHKELDMTEQLRLSLSHAYWYEDNTSETSDHQRKSIKIDFWNIE